MLKACNPPKDLNEISTMANKYLKRKVAISGSHGSTFVTTIDKVEPKHDEKRCTGNRKKETLEVFQLWEEHYVNNCLELLQLRKAHEGKTKQSTATWDTSKFTMYLVNAIGGKGIGLIEVLLDNQADISIMRPELLCEIELVDREIQVSGIGSVQLIVKSAGYL